MQAQAIAGNTEALVESRDEPLPHAIGLPKLLTPASRGSVTGRSWKIPAARSTCPSASAWGEAANII